MKLLIALLLLALTFAVGAVGLGASETQAAQNICKYRYNLCLARCGGPAQRCLGRCQTRYKGCITRMPYLGDLI